MKENASKEISEFLLIIMEMLNENQELNQSITDVLKEIGIFFCADYSFVYQVDHTGDFCLHECYNASIYGQLPSKLNLSSYLGEGFMEDLSKEKYLLVRENVYRNNSDGRLRKLFQVNSMLLVPITNQNQKVIALIGVADKRSNAMLGDWDLQFVYSILAVAANHVKLRIYQKKADTTRNSLESIINNTNVGIYVNDFYTQEVLYANHFMAEAYGGIENMIGKICWKVLYDDKTEPCDYCPRLKLIDRWGNPTNVHTWDYQRPFDGSWFRVFSSAFYWVDGRLAHIVSSVNITENKENEKLIRQMAEYDALTGLPNRRKLLMDSDRSLGEFQDLNRDGYLMFFDLDGFKSVNDQYGHRAGDELLVEIGKFLQSNEFTKNKSYRYGGDEFVILCLNEDINFLKKVIGTLRERFSKPWTLENGIVFVNNSIGIARYREDAENASELIHHADMAMYSAKKAGKGSIMFFDQGSICDLDKYSDKEGD